MAIIRKYIDAGKPLVGIRTACHAFDTRGKAPAGHAEWKTFDPDVLGGHYTGHYPQRSSPGDLARAERQDAHPIVRDVETPFISKGSLYKTSPLAAGTQALLVGTIPGQPPEPVAWIRMRDRPRVFYTSLGHPGDFENPSFRRLLRNAVFWALDRPPASDADDQGGESQRPSRRGAGGAAPLLIVARARFRPRGPGLIQGSRRSCSSSWSWPSRSFASRSRSRSTSGGGSGWCSTCSIRIRRG